LHDDIYYSTESVSILYKHEDTSNSQRTESASVHTLPYTYTYTTLYLQDDTVTHSVQNQYLAFSYMKILVTQNRYPAYTYMILPETH
jgi:hypothetical protein